MDSAKKFWEDMKRKWSGKVTQPHHGLRNQGSTCYLNSVLQVLFMTPEIHDRLDQESQKSDKELRSVFEKLTKTTCGTENITQCWKINVNQQCDAAECLEMILNQISSQASEVFQGKLTYKTTCSSGHSISEETNPFWTLPLSLKDACDTAYSVKMNFERTFVPKKFSGDNMAFCNKCDKNTEATSECELAEPPQILTLLLKRFNFDYETRSHVKSDSCVDVPLVLQTELMKYKLYGMVNHEGSLTGGHYTATIRSKKDKAWYEFNDDYVKKAEGRAFTKQTYTSSTAYLLMYRGKRVKQRKSIPERNTKHKVAPSNLRKKVQHSSKKHLGEETDETKQRGPESQIPAETSSTNLMDEAKEKQDENIRNVIKDHTDDKENPQLGHSEEDEGQMRRNPKEETPSLQAGGQEGDTESEKRCDTCKTSGIHSVMSSKGEAQEDRMHAAITGENHKPVKAKEANAEDASLDVKEKTQDAPLNVNKKTEDVPLNIKEKTQDAPLNVNKKTEDAPLNVKEKTEDAPLNAKEKTEDAPLKVKEMTEALLNAKTRIRRNRDGEAETETDRSIVTTSEFLTAEVKQSTTL